VYNYSDGTDLLQAQEPQQTYQEISPPLIHTCRHSQKHERVNMRSHVSTTRYPYILTSGHTPTLPHTKFFSFLASQSGANLQRDPNTHQPRSRHREDCAA